MHTYICFEDNATTSFINDWMVFAPSLVPSSAWAKFLDEVRV